jgi:hypothetical protein
MQRKSPTWIAFSMTLHNKRKSNALSRSLLISKFGG